MMCWVLTAGMLQAQLPAATPLVEGKRALAAKDFAGAKTIFAAYVKQHPGDVQGEMGVGDAELGLRHYEAAELQYRKVVAVQPQLWTAHKNLVITEAGLGRWEEFDRERAVLRAARERGAAGISKRDSDVIEVLQVAGQRWIVRDYFEPAGRTQTVYNFERFGADGRVSAYVSLESASALSERTGGGVVIGGAPNKAPEMSGYALDFYTGASHGRIETYATEPRYERVRSDFVKWAQARGVEK